MRKHTALLLRLSVIYSLAPYFLFAQQHGSSTPTPAPSTSERSKTARKADEIYANLGYKTAADIYQKSSTGKLDMLSMERVANSYRLNGETEKAETWYEKVVTPESSTDLMLQYAQVLHSNAKCADATKWFLLYAEKMKATQAKSTITIPSCNTTIESKETQVMLANLNSLNSDHQEFAAVPYKNGIVFTSTKKTEHSSTCSDCWTKDNFSDIFFAEKTGDNVFLAAKPIMGNINTRLHDGVVSFNPAGDVMYFSRSSDRKRAVDGIRELKICMATEKNGFWGNAIDLPFNSDSFSSCHPALTNSGKKMYFASNRPGGFGGMDIWVTTLVNEKWSEPKNLGETINTSGNEVFPYINDNGFLFFSSDGHESLGGLDVFVAREEFADTESWMAIENLGKPFNSNDDDFGFNINKELTSGMVSSNRKGGKGSDDIYTWSSVHPLDFFLKRHIGFVDAETKAIISRVVCSVVEMPTIDNQLLQTEYRTNEAGIFSYTIRPEKTYRFSATMPGYKPIEKILTGGELLRMREIWLPLAPIKYIGFAGNVIEKMSKSAIVDANVEVLNTTTKEKIAVTTDKDGHVFCSLPLGCDFEIRAVKSTFEPVMGSFSTKNTLDNVEKTLEMTAFPSANNNNTNGLSGNGTTKNYFDPTVFKIGHIILLQGLLYDYNKFNIRDDAAIELDKVLKLLQDFPSMEIELFSHTDTRGNDRYNQQLSDQRAASAKAYLVEKGIDATRIVAKGMGETSPLNDCKGGKACNEALHEQNRRTEIRITKFNAEDIKLEINDKRLKVSPVMNR
jgi:outer membrane protein OmpA-like peptidoglycan-associated protein